MEAVLDSGKSLLRPHQLADARQELKNLEAKMTSPHIEDKAEAAKQFRRVSKAVAEQTPIPPQNPEEEGRMVARSSYLLNKILVGMPSQEEMRKAPPGAVDKHMGWEKRNKAYIQEWKNLQLRLTHGKEQEAANLERHRPVSSSLNMDNAVIPGKQFFFTPTMTALPAAFTDEQIAVLELIAPDIRSKLATLTNAERHTVKELVDIAKGGIGLEDAPDPVLSAAGKRGAQKKKELSQARKDALARGRATAAANRAAKKA